MIKVVIPSIKHIHYNKSIIQKKEQEGLHLYSILLFYFFYLFLFSLLVCFFFNKDKKKKNKERKKKIEKDWTE
jgi:heme/copper-type cytochrome/quinol oxidase subunit 2